jgi:hypothetical protein
MVYLLSGLLAGGILTAICWPLFSKGDSMESAILEETEWDLLLRKKDVVLANIQDLDFEYRCGKLSVEDYNRSRDELTAEVGRVFDAIDRIEGAQDLDSLIRTEVAARRSKSAGGEAASKPGYCPECGHSNSRKNKFCAECGTPLR